MFKIKKAKPCPGSDKAAGMAQSYALQISKDGFLEGIHSLRKPCS